MPVSFAGLGEVQANLVKAALYFRASGAQYLPQEQYKPDMRLDPKVSYNAQFLASAHAYAAAAVSDRAYFTEFLPLADQFVANVVPITLPSRAITHEKAHPLLDSFRPSKKKPPANLLTTFIAVFDKPKLKPSLDGFAQLMRNLVQETLSIPRNPEVQEPLPPLTSVVNHLPVWLHLHMRRFETPLYTWMHKNES